MDMVISLNSNRSARNLACYVHLGKTDFIRHSVFATVCFPNGQRTKGSQR